MRLVLAAPSIQLRISSTSSAAARTAGGGERHTRRSSRGGGASGSRYSWASPPRAPGYPAAVPKAPSSGSRGSWPCAWTVGTVAGEAAVRQDRPDVAVVATRAGVAGRPGRVGSAARVPSGTESRRPSGQAAPDAIQRRSVSTCRPERSRLARHAFAGIGVRDTLDQEARRGIARRHRSAGLAAFSKRCRRVEAEPGPAHAPAVAADAGAGQERLHVAGEIGGGVRCRAQRARGSARQGERRGECRGHGNALAEVDRPHGRRLGWRGFYFATTRQVLLDGIDHATRYVGASRLRAGATLRGREGGFVGAD